MGGRRRFVRTLLRLFCVSARFFFGPWSSFHRRCLMTRRFAAACGFGVACLAAGLLVAVPALQAQDTHTAHKDAAKSDAHAMSSKVGPGEPPATEAEKIKSAMSAAPASIAKDPTILDME